ncbi:GGDEF domain-containing protein [Cohnella endophytica]|uniref:GGDEF domain-containing protein n=1 Tax=Cohnella endophytica TaxID=2419778 RepID=A0A494XW90_9BACL|nr:GGDEF domain-containing protein [Cohnella endophytica]RKP54115.1 GGDEF domain-containing protein [Cohnella endophytica]
MVKKESESLLEIFIKLGVAFTLIGLSTFLVIFYLIENKFKVGQREEISSVTGLITSAIEAADKSADAYEQLVDLRMYSVSKAIAKQLQGRTASTITESELFKLKEEWGLSDISLFVRIDEDIVVGKSTDPEEVGLSSKGWGYWFKAFQQLFEHKPVEVNEGFKAPDFWAGPLTKSVLYSEQFLYAYYYDGTTDFIINPYVSAANVQTFIDSFGSNGLIDDMIKGSDDIVEIAVLNIEPYLNQATLTVIEPQRDLPILYGKHEMKLKEDQSILSKDRLTREGGEAVSFRMKGQSYKKFYLPLSKNRVLTIVINTSVREKTINQILAMMAFVFVVSFGIIYAVAKKMSGRFLILHEKNRKLAYYDTLTGLPNRNHFQEHLRTTLNKANAGNIYAIFMIDLDNFKNINDSLGHAAGDSFLQYVSSRINRQLNGNGFLARIGGDEFTLVLPIHHRSDANEVAIGLMSCVKEPVQLEGQQLLVSMSMGISVYPDDGKDMTSLLKNADMALYCEKYNGKNNFSFFNSDIRVNQSSSGRC